MTYFYGMRTRGFSIGAQPRGVINRHDDKSGKYWDIIEYSEPLTADDIEHYSLDRVDKCGDAWKRFFDPDTLEKARELFYKVYVDIETDTEYEGHDDPEFTTGDRIRVYATGWTYETPECFTSTAALAEYMKDYEENYIPFS